MTTPSSSLRLSKAGSRLLERRQRISNQGHPRKTDIARLSMGGCGGVKSVSSMMRTLRLRTGWCVRQSIARRRALGCFLYLRNVKGYEWNHKRVYRIYCELELNLRIRPRKRLKRPKPDELLCRKPLTTHGRWTSCRISLQMDESSGR